jgi:hypothetical protein
MSRGTNIYQVQDVCEQYGGSPAYAVIHIHEGVVSVWDSLEFAKLIAEDLETDAAYGIFPVI